MMTLRLMTTTGAFKTVFTHEVDTVTEARALVEAHAAANNMTNVKYEGDIDNARFTATTPGGRRGRNIAFLDF